VTTIGSNRITIAPPHAETLQSSTLRVRTVPSCGAKITELRSLASGRDWLWVNPRHMLRQGKPFASYVAEFDTGGWDELFPTVDPIAPGVPLDGWGTAGLTDHGEVWHRQWSTERTGSLSVTQSVVGEAPSFEFTRSLRLDRLHPTMRLKYRISNAGHAGLPYLWAAHPLFRCDTGMSIEIDPRTPVMSARRYDTDEPGRLSCGTWGQIIDRFGFLNRAGGWSDAERRGGMTLKVFLRLTGTRSIALHDWRSGERLVIADPAGTIEYAALWLNFGGWSGDGNVSYCNIGIEPTTCAGDTPLAADDRLEPGESREWSLAVSIEQ
jgi:galactose mutarotase-like enzyme